MKVGIPREVKDNEYRVAITPAGAHELVVAGHTVVIEKEAGAGSSIPDEEFVRAGAEILGSADDVWAEADLVLKVKEPVAEEYHRMRRGQVLFTYLHLAASEECTDALVPPARRPSPTRRSSCRTARCRCSPRCRRWRGGWPPRSAPTT